MTSTRPFPSPASDSLEGDSLTMTSPSGDIPKPVPHLSISNPETSFLSSSFPPAGNKSRTLYQACTCERCTKLKINKKTTEGNSSLPDTAIRNFLHPRLLELLSEYWEALKVTEQRIWDKKLPSFLLPDSYSGPEADLALSVEVISFQEEDRARLTFSRPRSRVEGCGLSKAITPAQSKYWGRNTLVPGPFSLWYSRSEI
jgi:hypothetical protein